MHTLEALDIEVSARLAKHVNDAGIATGGS